MDDSPQVDVDDPVPIVQGDLPGIPAVDDAGIVHGDMELAEALDRRVAHPIHGVGVAYVDCDRVNVSSALGQLRRVTLKVLFVDVGHHDPHALLDERLHQGQPDPTGRPGDHGRPPCQSVHRPMVPGAAVVAPWSRVRPDRRRSAKIVDVMERYG